jgi:hypothetical protein
VVTTEVRPFAGLRRVADDDALCQRLRANGPAAARRYDRTNLAARMLEVLRGVRAEVGPR